MGGDCHESKQSLLYFSDSDLSYHLHHVGAKRADATEDLIVLLYDRVDKRFSSLDLERIFISLGTEGR